MPRLGSLNEWARYLGTRSDEEAAAALAKLSRQIDCLYDDLSVVTVRLSDSPTGEVADVLAVARSALAEAAGMLDAVQVRFDSGEREPA